MGICFEFYPTESKILDYLYLPTLIHFKEKEEQESNYEDEIAEEIRKVFRVINSKLKPYSSILCKYYLDEVNIIFLLATRHSFFGYKNINDYLEYLLTLGDEEILKAIIYGLKMKEMKTYDKQQAIELAEIIIKDEAQIMSFISSLEYSGEIKWQLLWFSKSPKKYLADCIGALRNIEPIFNEYYIPQESYIYEYSNEFQRRLNSMEGDPLSQITNGIVKSNTIIDDTKRFVVSYFGSYTIHIYGSSTPAFMAWGLEIEKVFKKLIEKDEHRLTERILLFKNLGDRTRYEVLKCIAKGITSTKVIAEQLGVSSATISYHLNNLLTSKLIVFLQQEGRYDYVVNHDFIEQCYKDFKEDLYHKQ